jgi:hypothetical protein
MAKKERKIVRWEKEAGWEERRRKRGKEGEKKGPGTRYSYQGNAPKDPFPPTRSCLLSFHHLPITHQNMRSEPSCSNHFTKVPPQNTVALGTMPSTHELLQDISD